MGVEDPSGQDGDGIPSWYDGNRVAKARVLLVGAGSLGEETALALYGRGFRRVLMVDPGTVGRDDIGHLALVGEEDVVPRCRPRIWRHPLHVPASHTMWDASVNWKGGTSR